MKKYESLIIGHVTMDENIDYTGAKVFSEGGAVLYSSAAACGTGHKVAALTVLAEKDAGRLDAFRLPKEDVFCIYKEKSTDMYNRYFTADRERRDSRCTSRGTPFEKEDFATVPEAEIYHLAGLLYGDYGEGTVEYLATKGSVAADAQGFLRRADADGRMYFEDWAEKRKIIPFVTFLKTDAAEAEILTGTSDRAEAARMLCGMGAKEVLITHNTEVLVCDGKEIYTCPIKAESLAGRTGRGDTTFAVYVTERLTRPIADALRFATAAVSLKMATPGPYAGNREDVEKFIVNNYGGI